MGSEVGRTAGAGVDDVITRDQAEGHIHGVCFKTGPPRSAGVELEWLVVDRAEPRGPVEPGRLDAALAPLGATAGQPGGALPGGTLLTLEPGGQLELSTPPAVGAVACVAAAAADLGLVRRALERQGLRLAGYGLEPFRDPSRVLDQPRYAAMEAYLDRIGPWGRMMMRATAAVQVNLDAGTDGPGQDGYRARWQLSHRLGPVLVAAFANSPLWHGRPTGWKSTRQAVWEHLDPSRTRPPAGPDGDPREAFARFALDAGLLCLRREPPADWTAPPGHSFADWLAGGVDERRPTRGDLDYHLSTLFPPVRPRGWLELRMIDAQPGDGWIVPALVTTVLMDDPTAAEAAWAATEPLCVNGSPYPSQSVWTRAARLGPAAPELAKAALACFAAVDSALDRPDVPATLRRSVAAFAERYLEHGRCPADDLLDDRAAQRQPARLEGTLP